MTLDKKTERYIISALRRINTWSAERRAAKTAARVQRGKYACEKCKGIFDEIKLDHREPVVDPLVGRTTWDSYISRMFVNAAGYAVLCYACHKLKTQEENSRRKLGIKKYKTKTKRCNNKRKRGNTKKNGKR